MQRPPQDRVDTHAEQSFAMHTIRSRVFAVLADLVDAADRLHAEDPNYFDPLRFCQSSRIAVEEACELLPEDAPWHRVVHVAWSLDGELSVAPGRTLDPQHPGREAPTGGCGNATARELGPYRAASTKPRAATRRRAWASL